MAASFNGTRWSDSLPGSKSVRAAINFFAAIKSLGLLTQSIARRSRSSHIAAGVATLASDSLVDLEDGRERGPRRKPRRESAIWIWRTEALLFEQPDQARTLCPGRPRAEGTRLL